MVVVSWDVDLRSRRYAGLGQKSDPGHYTIVEECNGHVHLIWTELHLALKMCAWCCQVITNACIAVLLKDSGLAFMCYAVMSS